MKRTFTSALWGVILLLMFSSCNSENTLEEPFSGKNSMLQVLIDNTALLEVQESLENPITNSNIIFYAFTQGEDNAKTLVHVFDSSNISSQLNGQTTTLTLKFPQRIEDNISLVALVNHTIPSEKIEIGMTYQKMKDLFGFTVNGKIENPLKLPFWGIKDFNLKEQKGIPLKFNLFRSYARTNISIADDQKDAPFKMKEITSVRVYRSLSNGNANTEVNNIKSTSITKPNVPSNPIGGKYNTDKAIAVNTIEEANLDPLTYTLPQPLQNFNNRLFLIESNQDQNTNRSEAVAIIVGVKLQDYEDVERFYRLDYADYTEKSVHFKPIIRNHSYVFNMNGAKDDGSENPEEALKTKASVNLDVVDWEDYEILGDNLNGEYYFRLKNEGITFSYLENDTKEIEFSTNFNLSQIQKFLKIDFAHSDSYFRSEVDFPKRKIKITTQLLNDTDNYIEDKLSITLLKQSFEIDVKQRYETAQFIISPRKEHYELNGVYTVAKPLQANKHTIKVRLYATERIKPNMSFNLKAEETNGIYINYDGRFGNMTQEGNRYYEDFTIDIQGTIINPKDFYLTINTDCDEPTFLTVKIPVAYTQKTILLLTNGGELNANVGFKKLISEDNFGITKPTAPVQSEGIIFLESNNSDLNFEISSKKPDIIIIGKGYTIDENKARILKGFMTVRNSYGGFNPVIYMSSDSEVGFILKELDVLTDEYKNKPLSSVIKVLDQTPVFISAVEKNNDYKYRFVIPTLDVDYISNGSFMNIGGLHFKLNRTASAVQTDALKYDRIMKYSGNLPFGILNVNLRKDFANTIFTDIEHAFMCISDGDFLNISSWDFNADGSIKNTPNQVPKPIVRDVDKPLFLLNNSLLFANILEWAIFTVEYGNIIKR